MHSLILYQEDQLPSEQVLTTFWYGPGIFPATIDVWRRWAEEAVEALKACTVYVDMYPLTWPVHIPVQHYNPNALQIQWGSLVSFWNFDLEEFPDDGYPDSWLHTLEGKTVLYIGAFPVSAKKQFERSDSRAPRFRQLKIIPTPQAFAGNTPAGYEGKTVFDALQDIYRAVDRIGDFDIALVSAGGSAPLIAHHIFKKGRSAVYFGGSLQGVFGIKGTRWLSPLLHFLERHPEYASWWIDPDPSERPPNCEKQEDCPYFIK